MNLVSNLKKKLQKNRQFSKRNKLTIRNFIFFLFLVTACTKKLPENNFNTKAWQNDPLACNNNRLELLPELEKVRPQLLGLRETEIQKLLGKPDATSLTDQSERIYFYYIEPGPQCTQKSYFSSANKLQVRMNSMGFVIEINYEQPVKK
ncbi:hypothetical protein [Adhaeribacter terreus]|uniref:Outer membrane protein assembly factor BamE n=1 Tax=Adhaeribacter terreus TaxID=529703 RepID=A0ABW0E834_9BACT